MYQKVFQKRDVNTCEAKVIKISTNCERANEICQLQISVNPPPENINLYVECDAVHSGFIKYVRVDAPTKRRPICVSPI